MAARLAPVRVSAIGAETTGYSVSTARNAGSVLLERGAIMVSARADHAWISSRCRIAVKHAVSIPSSQRSKRSAGGPLARSPNARRALAQTNLHQFGRIRRQYPRKNQT